MGLGRIAALLGVATPAAESPVQPDAVPTDRTAAASAGAHADFNAKDGTGKSDIAAQIEAVITAIRQLDDNASQDGAGMAFSRSGATLRDSVGALGHLMTTARETGVALSGDLVQDAGDAVGAVESRLRTVQDGVEQRAHRLPPSDEARVRETAGRFVAEMQAVITHTRGVIAGFGGRDLP